MDYAVDDPEDSGISWGETSGWESPKYEANNPTCTSASSQTRNSDRARAVGFIVNHTTNLPHKIQVFRTPSSPVGSFVQQMNS